jgi:hypothetical protein
MQRALLLLTFLPVLALGCGPGTPATPGSEGSDDESSTSTAAPTSTSSAAGTTSSSSSTTDDEPSTSSTSAASTSGATTSTFIQTLDLNIAESCDAFQQDCPAGEKCMPYADDGGTSWNNTKCVPVMDDPAGVGEPCFAVDSGVSGLDNCELGAMCWDVDEQQNGECVALCVGSPDFPTCTQGFSCTSSRSASFGLCIGNCDPLIQDCNPGSVCINTSGPEFLCVLDASGRDGQLHDGCDFSNECDPGLWCADPASAKECDLNQTGCCEPFCDLTAPNTCPGEDQVCIPFFDPAPNPEGLEDVGRCTLP